jgi:hypothetical protein
MKIVRHLKSNKKYLKFCRTKIKIERVWQNAIIYICLYLNKDGMIWVRLEQDFNNNFK